MKIFFNSSDCLCIFLIFLNITDVYICTQTYQFKELVKNFPNKY
jgi:hypothetical protein